MFNESATTNTTSFVEHGVGHLSIDLNVGAAMPAQSEPGSGGGSGSAAGTVGGGPLQPSDGPLTHPGLQQVQPLSGGVPSRAGELGSGGYGRGGMGGFNGAAAAGAMLQRATSAPPVSDNVSEWAQGTGGSPQPPPGNLDPEYMYYYYAPHTLNPRQPRSSNAQQGGASQGSPSQQALVAPVALGGKQGGGLLQPAGGVLRAGAGDLLANRQSSASPGVPGAHLDMSLEAYTQQRRGSQTGPAGSPPGAHAQGAAQQAAAESAAAAVAAAAGVAPQQAIVGLGMHQQGAGARAGVAAGGLDPGAAATWEQAPRGIADVDSLGASLKGLGLGPAQQQHQQQQNHQQQQQQQRAQAYPPSAAAPPMPALYQGDGMQQDRRGGGAMVAGGGYPGYEDPLMGRGGGGQPLGGHGQQGYGRHPIDGGGGGGYGDARQHQYRGGREDSGRDARGDPHAPPHMAHAQQHRDMRNARGQQDMRRMEPHMQDGYYAAPPVGGPQAVYMDPRDGYSRMAYARVPPQQGYGEAMYGEGPGGRYYSQPPPPQQHHGYGGEVGYLRGGYMDGMDPYGRDDGLMRDDMGNRGMGMGGGGGGGGRAPYRRDDRGGYRRGGGGHRDDHRGGGGGGGGGGRGTLLDEFRSSIGKGRKWDLQDLRGHTVQFCRDQHGSRFIQQKLEVASEAEKAAFFEEVVPHAQSLMTDVFGNYVIQKLFDHGGPDQRENLASFLVGHAVQLSLQMYGCRVVQKALEFASIDTLIALVSEFSGQVMKCVQDQNGNHVIQKCIEVVCATAKAEGAYLHSHIQFIIDAFMGQVEKLSTHAYGCRVIQRILEHCIDAQRDPVLEEIRNSFSALIQDQYGNYVIQHVLKHGRPSDRVMLMNEVRVHLLPYSQHKFASNVVEKCLQYGTREERGALIHHLTHGHAEGQASLLQVMVCDPYANYVVQKIIDVADAEQREGIITEIRAHAAQLKRYTFGKHIISRLEKISGKKM